jgi:hypothetical protein
MRQPERHSAPLVVERAQIGAMSGKEVSRAREKFGPALWISGMSHRHNRKALTCQHLDAVHQTQLRSGKI